ncbi:hypothetical protein [uncultured Kiloniella sp.]|uniref:hypothetical protein n=1 Tax=uncultured Kiloniella sp. TaxID=1133091 RepID=UPI002632DA65|nr:hypothetical protein [uncultured Kiloniella sp.]
MTRYLRRFAILLSSAVWVSSLSIPAFAEGIVSHKLFESVEDATPVLMPLNSRGVTGFGGSAAVISVAYKDERPTKQGFLYEQYKDWQANAETFVTEDGELRTICSIRTGGDGDDSITVSISDGDALPPNAMPYVEYQEATARGYPTYLQKNQIVLWGINSGDTNRSYESSAYVGIDEEGIPYANVSGNGQEQDILRGFAKGDKVVLLDDYSGGDLYVGSLSGFSAAYRKMAAWCGFSPDSVLK